MCRIRNKAAAKFVTADAPTKEENDGGRVLHREQRPRAPSASVPWYQTQFIRVKQLQVDQSNRRTQSRSYGDIVANLVTSRLLAVAAFARAVCRTGRRLSEHRGQSKSRKMISQHLQIHTG
ncbi:hypothetical protein F444_11120 [Phytophthora nicotianae P1976]|uniref:Uncharacterized protein n=1 Tax=Phytophthora nicotianae P1976 TaxID=1317066 RepID=A0A081A1Y8_PHYNI|nr:hypothetical protein F444_11120 [Phytophthora nicotianae P1976]